MLTHQLPEACPVDSFPVKVLSLSTQTKIVLYWRSIDWPGNFPDKDTLHPSYSYPGMLSSRCTGRRRAGEDFL